MASRIGQFTDPNAPPADLFNIWRDDYMLPPQRSRTSLSWTAQTKKTGQTGGNDGQTGQELSAGTATAGGRRAGLEAADVAQLNGRAEDVVAVRIPPSRRHAVAIAAREERCAIGGASCARIGGDNSCGAATGGEKVQAIHVCAHEGLH